MIQSSIYLEDTPEGWDGTSVRIVGTDSKGEPVAVVNFKLCRAHMFGPPNDEALSSHPLAKRGLRPYGVFEIRNSSWVRKLEKMNAVHPNHDKLKFFESRKHFIFLFHDTTFECVAASFTVDVFSGSVKSMIPHMLESIR